MTGIGIPLKLNGKEYSIMESYDPPEWKPDISSLKKVVAFLP
jgi:hypothetical protein